MSSKMPPYGRQLVIPQQIPFLFLFVGEPDCWQHAQNQLDNGFHNFLCLPDAATVSDYFWPVADSSVIAIVFIELSAEAESHLIAVLCRFNPIEVIIRHWPGTDLIVRRRSIP